MWGILCCGAMRLVFLVLLVGYCRAHYETRCAGNEVNNKTLVTVKPSEDGVAARYVVEFCSKSNLPVDKWELIMSYVPGKSKENCTYANLQEKYKGIVHSYSLENISLDKSCEYTCFSKKMDLMFRSCYRMTNQVSGTFTTQPVHFNYYADNNVTGFTRDTTSSQVVQPIEYDNRVSFYWYEGVIPITDYEVSLTKNDSQFVVESEVTDNCTHKSHAVHCVLKLEEGCYVLSFQHTAPWAQGFRNLVYYNAAYCHKVVQQEPNVVPSWSNAWWWAAAAALAGLAAAVGVWRLRRDAKDKLLVLRAWRERGEAAEKESSATNTNSPSGPVLVLYAADCDAASAVAAALVRLLRESLDVQIYDLYSPEVSTLAAPSPAGWVRACVAARDVRVLLLQTPALAALHAPRRKDSGDTVNLEEPLLGRRALPRRPQFADSLLQYALQLIGETAHAQPIPHYKKYFLCTVSGVDTDVLPSVVPYTRYTLPAARTALLHALRGRDLTSPVDQQLDDACKELVRYVKDNPNYLADTLVFL